MATAKVSAPRRCCVCNMGIVRTNYISLSHNLENKRDKIFVLGIFLAIEIRSELPTFICKRCDRVVDNLGANVRKLKELHFSKENTSVNPPPQQGNVQAATPRKFQGEGRVEKRMAALSPSSSAAASASSASPRSRLKKRTALSFKQPTTTAAVTAEVKFIHILY